MQPNDRPRFLTLLTGIADYYSKEISTGTIGLYWEGLRQYDVEAVERALWQHTQNPDSGQFMPKIADVTRVLQGRTEDQAQLAWSKVDRAVRQVGIWTDVAFDDPIIHRVLLDMGGWVRTCSHDDDGWPFVAKEFINRYRGFRISGQIPEYPRYLLGTASTHNTAEGLAKPCVRLIGNAEVARQVIASGRALETPLLGGDAKGAAPAAPLVIAA
ncbi:MULTISPECIES: DUF6475 domain-containing protein [unclassified Massilia]|uniref:DUF6475 domain-containing protein n=1 Tax=unclassified Massilia TaxID=2609279 RepID=UPI001785A665|nr:MULTISPECIES: DUF6475 domain-containing protein [unclassified Massilia]MBD8531547.1 hypothetical protein [Massilia sp. CFBP 13647]MBD8673657.1 hypothetical protein [Massilia sp. CFBP 13721]